MPLVRATDISNWHGPLTSDDIGVLRAANVSLVIVRASLESQALIDIARQQVDAARQAGFALGLYVWVYPAPWEARATVAAVQRLFPDIATVRRYLWLDVEDIKSWTGHSPQELRQWIADAVDEAHSRLIRCGIYTAEWCWGPLTAEWTAPGNQGVPLWWANYDGIATIDFTLPFGGWDACLGKQYTATFPTPSGFLQGADSSVFDTAVLQ